MSPLVPGIPPRRVMRMAAIFPQDSREIGLASQAIGRV
jgi:hypothetical protein